MVCNRNSGVAMRKMGDAGLQGYLTPEIQTTITSSSVNTELWSAKLSNMTERSCLMSGP